MQRSAAMLVLALAFAGACLARPMARGRGLSQSGEMSTTWNVEWDAAYMPYPRVQALCGDLITFRWEGSQPQTVGVLEAAFVAGAQARCKTAVPLTDAATVGEHTEELLTSGTYVFVEPTKCTQALMVDVVCNDAVAGALGVDAPTPTASPSLDVAAPAPDFATTSDEGAPVAAPAAAPAPAPTAV